MFLCIFILAIVWSSFCIVSYIPLTIFTNVIFIYAIHTRLTPVFHCTNPASGCKILTNFFFVNHLSSKHMHIHTVLSCDQAWRQSTLSTWTSCSKECCRQRPGTVFALAWSAIPYNSYVCGNAPQEEQQIRKQLGTWAAEEHLKWPREGKNGGLGTVPPAGDGGKDPGGGLTA